MATRFNSRKNNPNSGALVPKKKVLREFQKLQDQIKSIHQETLVPPGEPIGPYMDGGSKHGGVSNRLGS